MARRDSYEDEEDDAGDPEEPDEADMDDDDEEGPDVVACPHCGADVSEDAERCPRCRNWLSHEDAPGRKPTWIIVTSVVLVVAIVVAWVLWGG